MDKQKQIWDEFEAKSRALIMEYTESMRKLNQIPRTIPEAQKKANAEQIVKSIEEKMSEIGMQFRQKMDALSEEFVKKLSETGV